MCFPSGLRLTSLRFLSRGISLGTQFRSRSAQPAVSSNGDRRIESPLIDSYAFSDFWESACKAPRLHVKHIGLISSECKCMRKTLSGCKGYTNDSVFWRYIVNNDKWRTISCDFDQHIGG